MKTVAFSAETASGEPPDPLYQLAVGLVLKAGKASAFVLQRGLRIGYGRATHLIDLMEQNGLVGPASSAAPRELLKGALGSQGRNTTKSVVYNKKVLVTGTPGGSDNGAQFLTPPSILDTPVKNCAPLSGGAPGGNPAGGLPPPSSQDELPGPPAPPPTPLERGMVTCTKRNFHARHTDARGIVHTGCLLLGECCTPVGESLFPVSRSQFFRLVNKYALAAGIPRRKCKTHMLKHTIAKHLVRAGHPVNEIMEWMGWRSMETMMWYIRPDEEELGQRIGDRIRGMQGLRAVRQGSLFP